MTLAGELVPQILNYRVVNWKTGAVIVSELAHGGSSWQVHGMQPGASASITEGSFTISLFPPSSEGYDLYYQQYAQVMRGHRVEGYDGPIGAGAPAVAGIILDIALDTEGDTFVLTGTTDMGLLARQKAWLGDGSTSRFDGTPLVSPINSQTVFDRYASLIKTQWMDDFSAYSAGNYTVGGTWTATTYSQPAVSVITSSAAGTNTLKRASAVTIYDQLNGPEALEGAMIEAFFWFDPTTDATNGGEAGIVIDTWKGTLTGSLFIYLRAVNSQLNLLATNADGTTTLASNVLPFPSAAGVYQMTLAIYGPSGGATTANYTAPVANVSINGGQLYAVDTPQLSEALSVGLYFKQAASGTAQAWFTNFVCWQRPNLYAPNGSHQTIGSYFTRGTISAPVNPMFGLQQTGGQTYLDLITAAANVDGYLWRYTPGYLDPTALKLGTFDMSTSPGTDRTAQIVIQEGDFSALSLGAPATGFGTSIQMASVSGQDSGGQVTWRSVANLTTYGVLDDLGSLTPGGDFQTLQRWAQAVLANRVAGATSAKTIRIPRTAVTAQIRELDTITLNLPRYGLSQVSALVLARDYVGGATEITLALDQISEMGSQLAYLLRLGEPIKRLHQLSATASSRYTAP